MAEPGDQGNPIFKQVYPPNTVLCHQGEVCDEIYLLLRGAIQIVTDDQVIQTVDQPGSFVGELTPLFKQPRSQVRRRRAEYRRTRGGLSPDTRYRTRP